jgi:hypothetical protein
MFDSAHKKFLDLLLYINGQGGRIPLSKAPTHEPSLGAQPYGKGQYL